MKAGWALVGFLVSITSASRTIYRTTYSVAVVHAPIYSSPCLGPNKGGIVAYCCSGKSVSLGATSSPGEALVANFPIERGCSLLTCLTSVLVGNIFWTSLEEPALLKSGKGLLWQCSLSHLALCVLLSCWPDPTKFLRATEMSNINCYKFWGIHFIWEARSYWCSYWGKACKMSSSLIAGNPHGRTAMEVSQSAETFIKITSSFRRQRVQPEDTRHQAALAPLLIRLFSFTWVWNRLIAISYCFILHNLVPSIHFRKLKKMGVP